MKQINHLSPLGISGPDATTFLHGQFCADLLSVPEGSGGLTAWCTAKGRVITTLFAYRKADGWTLILPANLAAKVTQRLRLFVLRAKVELHPATNYILLGLDTKYARTLSPDLQQRLLPHPGTTGQGQRFLLAVSGSEYASLATAYPHSAPINQEHWTGHDVEAGLPWIDAGTTEQFLPQELNLEHWQGLSYTKGCYPGQEIVARLRYRGTVKRGLFRIQAAETLQSTLTSGRRLLDDTGNPVATVLYSGNTTTERLSVLAVMDFSAAAPALYVESGGSPLGVIGPVASAIL